MLNVKPPSRPRARIASRVRALCSAERAVFLRQVFLDVLAAGRHAGIQFERLEVQLGGDLAVEALQGLLERVQADDAPRAGDVGDEVDSQFVHGGIPAGRYRAIVRKRHVARSTPRSPRACLHRPAPYGSTKAIPCCIIWPAFDTCSP
jgi:hypothetical protein